MNLICWNCFGTASKGFPGLIKDMKTEYSASFVVLLETHTSGIQARKIARRTGFDNQFIKDRRGQSGGIWILWDSNHWNVKILKEYSQMVHVEVNPNSTSSWFITIVYGNPHYSQRQTLWNDIQDLHAEIDGLWALIGDFNAILKDSERIGPALSQSCTTES